MFVLQILTASILGTIFIGIITVLLGINFKPTEEKLEQLKKETEDLKAKYKSER